MADGCFLDLQGNAFDSQFILELVEWRSDLSFHNSPVVSKVSKVQIWSSIDQDQVNFN